MRLVIQTPDRRRAKPVQQRSLAELISPQIDLLMQMERLAANEGRGQAATATLLDGVAQIGQNLIVIARGKR